MIILKFQNLRKLLTRVTLVTQQFSNAVNLERFERDNESFNSTFLTFKIENNFRISRRISQEFYNNFQNFSRII